MCWTPCTNGIAYYSIITAAMIYKQRRVKFTCKYSIRNFLVQLWINIRRYKVIVCTQPKKTRWQTNSTRSSSTLLSGRWKVILVLLGTVIASVAIIVSSVVLLRSVEIVTMVVMVVIACNSITRAIRVFRRHSTALLDNSKQTSYLKYSIYNEIMWVRFEFHRIVEMVL